MVHDEHHQARLCVRGEVGAETVRKLRHHLDGLLKAGARFIVVDLTGTVSADPLVDARLHAHPTQRDDHHDRYRPDPGHEHPHHPRAERGGVGGERVPSAAEPPGRPAAGSAGRIATRAADQPIT
jgi:hypothetical protein